MKRLFVIIFVLAASAATASSETLSVQTRENAVRETCRFFAPVKARVSYGDQLTVVSREGDWVRVKFRDVSGCIHMSAVTDRKIDLSGVQGKSGAASTDEVALAGKGFNPQVETAYRQNHPELDFQKVDLIQQYRVPDDQLRKFIRNGGLREP